jgi:acetyl esterase/lipase
MRSSRRLRPRLLRRSALPVVIVALAALLASVAGPTPRAGAVNVVDVEVHTNITYYEPDTPTVNGNKLDLYVPVVPGEQTLPLLIWSSGSAWLSDNGRVVPPDVLDFFTARGYAVAGVSVRSSAQDSFPGQLHDIRAAIRWLRMHAADHNLDTTRFAIMGNSSGGWVSAIAGTTSDVVQLPGEPVVAGVSSAVQVAVPFFPPTDFLQMDPWFAENCASPPPPWGFVPGLCSALQHDLPLSPLPPPWIPITTASPESLLVRCTDAAGNLLGIQTCPNETEAANPIAYVDGEEVPMLILHGTVDSLVPHGQSELLYEALKEAGNEVTFVSVTGAWHLVSGDPTPFGGPIIGAEDFTVFHANRGGQETVTDGPAPTWENVEHFIHVALSRARGG